jgi:hypothetical protein
LPQVFTFTPLTPTNKGKLLLKKTYKPPGASTGFAAKFKAAKESAPGKLQIASAPITEDFIPGLAPEPAKKKKKKKNRLINSYLFFLF